MAEQIISRLPDKNTFGGMTLEELSGYASNATEIQRRAMQAANGDPLAGHILTKEEIQRRALQVLASGVKVFHKVKEKPYTVIGPVEGSAGMYFVANKEGKKIKVNGEHLVVIG